MTERVPALAELTSQLDVTAGRLVDRTRRFSAARWARAAGDRVLAEAVQALVTMLAEYAHAVETGAAPPPARWRSPDPAPYPGALPDRLAVVARDLVAALRAAPPEQQVWYAARLAPVEELAAAALGELQATADYAAS